MSNEDKMLQLVLSDKNLCKFYGFDAADFLTIKDALKAENPIVVSVAKIIKGINGSSDKSIQRDVYTEVFNYLNGNLL